MATPATATDWQHLPMPALRQQLPIERDFSTAEIAQLKLGLVPVEMEDKWFIYWQGNTLHFHRSWTGIAVYEVIFTSPDDAGSQAVSTCWVNADPTQYQHISNDDDLQMLNFLIGRLLLGNARRSGK